MEELGLSLAVGHVTSAMEGVSIIARDREVKAQSQVRLDIRADTGKGLKIGR